MIRLRVKKMERNAILPSKKDSSDAGIDIYTSLIVGYPQETQETIDDSFEVMRQARISRPRTQRTRAQPPTFAHLEQALPPD